MPATPDDLFAFFAKLGIAVTTVEHPPLFTVEDSKALRGQIAGGHTKNLFLKDRKGGLFLVVLEEDASVDLKRIHEIIGAQGKVSFGSADLLTQVWGVLPGAVTPFGAINDTEGQVTVVLDQGLLENDKLNHHPLVNTQTTTITREGLIAFLRATGHEPKILAVSQPQQAGA
ncbi:prolyl-tRNA synthetase associated domain-containing protein [Labrys sp. KNU-23]|uniref:prolyl-tRNA synthetase associated domain-containing protein n=1 Tax=Labrys sp. KNU-23 TaxID=2789216 RepID=UPI0011EF55B5|nr:prolyl-tRNA synthetase associated domain-containing protein [Labrys sp. KNU-23]QEN86161.1 prolyl-tRNA synthetase associated domain-containing protein [Labrys sp. KNU-23]